MNIPHALTALALSAAGVGAASAAALAQDQTSTDWSGFYLGIDAGLFSGASQSTHNTLTTDGTSPILVHVPATYGGADRSIDLFGELAGVQLGYATQAGALTFGVEADYLPSNAGGTDSFIGSPGGPSYVVDNAMTGIGTVRARIGYPMGRVMPYLTAGVAMAQTTGTVSVQSGVPGSLTGPAFVDSDSQTVWGYAIGAGMELALDDHWSLSGELRHMSFAPQSYTFNVQPGGVLTSRSNATVSANMVRVGLDYRF